MCVCVCIDCFLSRVCLVVNFVFVDLGNIIELFR